MVKSKGTEFEKLVHGFFKSLFEDMGFVVIEVRKQWSGTQNGFDVRITFLNEDDNECRLFFECKDYESQLDWNDIFPKICELDASNYHVDGFIALSPKVAISNINDNMVPKLLDRFPFPVKIWDTNSNVQEIFSMDKEVYKRVYGKDCHLNTDREKCLRKTKSVINSILNEKLVLKIVNRIEIESTDKQPNEDEAYKTNLDRKLDGVLNPDDIDRKKYHQMRCDYKIFLEGMADINNSVRSKILRWQENMRLKADRLTRKFRETDGYTARKFFHEFFDIAEKELNTFISAERLDGDIEKLLHGVVFELAAECPLDWTMRNDESNH